MAPSPSPSMSRRVFRGWEGAAHTTQSRSTSYSHLTELLQRRTAQHTSPSRATRRVWEGQHSPGSTFQGLRGEQILPQTQPGTIRGMGLFCLGNGHNLTLLLSGTNSRCIFPQLGCISILRCDTDFDRSPEAKPAKCGYSGNEGLAQTPPTLLSFQNMPSSTCCLSRSLWEFCPSWDVLV